jgi:hypothetical protein
LFFRKDVYKKKEEEEEILMKNIVSYFALGVFE